MNTKLRPCGTETLYVAAQLPHPAAGTAPVIDRSDEGEPG